MTPAIQSSTSTLPLMLLSGLLCDEEIWSDMLAELRPVCEPTAMSFHHFSSIEDMADHVLACAPRHFAVAGHSMGGRVALEICRRAPSRVLGVALLNTGTHLARSHEAASRGRLVDLAQRQGLTALAAQWLPPMLCDHKPPDPMLLSRLTRMVERNTAESFSGQIHALINRPEAETALAKLRVPALLLSATGDTWSPPHQLAAMRDLCPRAKLVILEDAGHMSPVEQPAAAAVSLKAWLVRITEAQRCGELSAIDRLLVREACALQIYKYARLSDAAAWSALSELFVESGVLYRPSSPNLSIRGRAAILDAFQARPSRLSRHLVTNVEIFVESACRAQAVSSIVLNAADGEHSAPVIASTAVGHFYDELIKINDEWLFAERRGTITMRSAATTGG